MLMRVVGSWTFCIKVCANYVLYQQHILLKQFPNLLRSVKRGIIIIWWQVFTIIINLSHWLLPGEAEIWRITIINTETYLSMVDRICNMDIASIRYDWTRSQKRPPLLEPPWPSIRRNSSYSILPLPGKCRDTEFDVLIHVNFVQNWKTN